MKHKFSFISAAIAATLSTHAFAGSSNPASMGYVQTQIEGVMSYVNTLFDAIPVTPTYTVGQQALGGTVIYVDNTGTHGLVASPKYSGLNSLKTWVGVDSDTDFVSFIVGASGNGCYGDYYLPSNYELYQMYLKRDVLNMWIDINTTPAFVWSSTELNGTDAYRINVSEPNQVVSSVSKNAGGGVWCIRQF